MGRWWFLWSLVAATACATGVEDNSAEDDGTGATGAAPTTGGAGAGGTGAGASSGGGGAEAGAGGEASGGDGGTSTTGGSGGVGGDPPPPVDCTGCTPAVAPACGSTAVVVGHYSGGPRTVCIQPGGGTFDLALMSYETTQWTLAGDVARVAQLQIYSFDAFGSITGNGGIPTAIQMGGSVPADPYDYSMSMGDCPAHTGYTGAVFGEAQANVCHMEMGLPSQCSSPTYSCLLIDP
jgi:hypothetical protein